MRAWNAIPIVAFAVAACGAADEGEQNGFEQRRFDQRGYFRNDARDRVYTFVLPQDATADQVRAHVSSLRGTAGRMLGAYYYEPGVVVPADGVTLAPDMARVNSVIYDDPRMGAWRYAYMEYRTGEREFVDCVATPSHDLCRR